ncbi:MAG: S8 family serine peptidase [Phycisphaerae bacterium]
MRRTWIITMLACAALLSAQRLPANQPLEPREHAGLAARTPYPKPATSRVLATVHEPHAIYVKFTDDAGVTTQDGKLANQQRPDVAALLQRCRSAQTGRWTPFHRIDPTALATFRDKAQQREHKVMPDLAQEFRLTLPAEDDVASVLDTLNNLALVEVALPIPRPVAATVPPDLQPNQGYLEPSTSGINAPCMWMLPGGTGTLVKIADIEYSWNANHGDLPVVTLLGPPPVDPFLDNNHGTAVLGELVGIPDGTGVTGGSHDSQAYFIAANTLGGYNVASAITTALTTLTAGDVIVIEQQTAGPNFKGNGQDGLVPSEWFFPVYNAVTTAVGNGVIVVAAAGNGAEDLDAPEYNSGHAPFAPGNYSGAIIVGAGGSPSSLSGDRARLAFSNYGSRIDLQGWGESVTTTGYGDAYDTEGVDLYFTNEFGGTSSATPIVAAACATVQSAYKNATGSVLSPSALRTALVSTGSPQLPGTFPALQNIGPRPDASRAIVQLIPTLDPNGNQIPDLCEGLPVGCTGYCGEESPDGCFCDAACPMFDDCCEDRCLACPASSGCCGNGICEAMESCEDCPDDCGVCGCAGYCGTQSPSGCHCDDECLSRGDCCPDVCDACPSTIGCCGDGLCDSMNENCSTCPADCGICGCTDFCGMLSPDGCYCDEGCIDFGDCCDDVCDACPDNGFCCLSPDEPAAPSPDNGAANVQTTITLTLTSEASSKQAPPGGASARNAETSNGCPTTYAFLLGQSPESMIPVCEDLPLPSCSVSDLPEGQLHYWQIVAENCCGMTAGPIWHFRTACALQAVLPEHCSVDSRQPHTPANPSIRFGWELVEVALACDAGGSTADDFEVSSETAPQPTIEALTIDGTVIAITLEEAIAPGGWTCIENAVGSRACVGYLPGDVDGNRSVDGMDIAAMIAALNQSPSRVDEQVDMDRNAVQEPEDLLRLIDILNGGETLQAWMGRSIGSCPDVP